jgi:hypothetical protein
MVSLARIVSEHVWNVHRFISRRLGENDFEPDGN